MDMPQAQFTLHCLQRMEERAIDENDIARSMCGTITRWDADEGVERWYAAGISVVLNVREGRYVTVIREVLNEYEPTRRRRGRT